MSRVVQHLVLAERLRQLEDPPVRHAADHAAAVQDQAAGGFGDSAACHALVYVAWRRGKRAGREAAHARVCKRVMPGCGVLLRTL